jgi:hypothetical protein
MCIYHMPCTSTRWLVAGGRCRYQQRGFWGPGRAPPPPAPAPGAQAHTHTHISQAVIFKPLGELGVCRLSSSAETAVVCRLASSCHHH